MDVNWIAVLVAAISAFVAGGIWYGPLFARKWMALNNFSEAELKQGNMVQTYGLAFVLSLISAAVFAMFLGRNPGVEFATGAGFAAGLCWVAASFGISYLFERRPLGLWLVNGGYHTVQFTLYGLVLGLMG
jgi:hypothetical protein